MEIKEDRFLKDDIENWVSNPVTTKLLESVRRDMEEAKFYILNHEIEDVESIIAMIRMTTKLATLKECERSIKYSSFLKEEDDRDIDNIVYYGEEI